MEMIRMNIQSVLKEADLAQLTWTVPCSLVFGLLYLYTAEIYPTEIRGTAIGLCCMLSRLGGIVAPQVTKFVNNIYN